METQPTAAAAAADSKPTSAMEHNPDCRDGEEDSEVVLTAKWGAKAIHLTFPPADFDTFTVLDLKAKIQAELNIPPERQKLLGITVGARAPQDGDLLPSLTFKAKNKHFMLIGTPADKALVDPSKEELPPVVNDLDGSSWGSWDFDPTEINAREVRSELHLARLKKATEKTEVRIIHQPRPGKKLLVLDLDYTLFDCKGQVSNIEDLKRPFLEQFMRSAWQNFDICVWSQTHWRWVEMKCTELGFLTSTNYNLLFVLDRSSMFTVSSRQRDGTPRQHEVKALEIIWSKFPDRYGPHNTLHIDDLSRNFAMNPKNGVKVSSYRMSQRAGDAELFMLTHYLNFAAQLADVTSVDHTNWKKHPSVTSLGLRQ